ncbi:hypothetical protein CEXT_61561 [Caerostris extrusa]|uniref:Uncharacterized protein n=1 Tax=Caerostris extrusa TaxID=172846 RepID=A0AAV4THQ0_CAEEX|nr:hypothetical protein CEXT_61561 [Caerostris extrusa]
MLLGRVGSNAGWVVDRLAISPARRPDGKDAAALNGLGWRGEALMELLENIADNLLFYHGPHKEIKEAHFDLFRRYKNLVEYFFFAFWRALFRWN